MRRPLLAMGVVLLVGLALMVHRGATGQRGAFGSLHVPQYGMIATIAPGGDACESNVWADRPFTWVAIRQGPPTVDEKERGPRPAVAVRVTEERTGRLLASGSLAADRSVPKGRDFDLDRRVEDDVPVRICFENTGRTDMSIWGGVAPSEATDDPYYAGGHRSQSDLTVNGKRAEGDLFLEFGSGQRRDRSLLVAWVDAFERMALFKLPWMGAWTFWVLGALLVLGAPAALGFALVRSVRDEDDPAG